MAAFLLHGVNPPLTGELIEMGVFNDSDRKVLIGVVHLPPLPGSPRYWRREYSVEDLVEQSVADSKAYEEAGFNAVIVENYGDYPYAVSLSSPLSAAVMSVVVREIVRETSLRVGVNVLRNDALTALSIAYAGGAHFIRVNAYCETRVGPEGVINPVARDLEQLRVTLPRRISVFADVDVKHSVALARRNLRDVVRDCVRRGLADALVVTGASTGEAPPPGYVAAMRVYAGPDTALIVGSGVTPENIGVYIDYVDGFIVGSYAKENGDPESSVSVERAKKLVERLQKLAKLIS